MALRNRVHLAERAAHDTVTAHTADTFHRDSGIDWPVSGDETRLAYGYRMARSHRVTSIWERPGVRPMGETYGIIPGCTIELCDGTELTVTRVGTLAGFGTDSHGIETPWNIDDVLHVTS